jgi:hypothetical protein
LTLGWAVKRRGEKTHLYVGIWPDEQLTPQKDGHSTDKVLRRRELCGGGVRAVTRIFIRRDVLTITFSVQANAYSQLIGRTFA